ncbi:MAG TPA: 4Fe-4S dicluster domain-containing protein [Saprospiraceae bacterium]|nr:4Fe-4S dicluster domain-containing protein [Saprospiraceae bacterium]
MQYNMKQSESTIWIDEQDFQASPEILAARESELDPIAVESILNDERAGMIETNRRDFLKVLGFGIGAATLASCEIPVKKAIPYVIKPDTIVPGIATYYASTFVQGGDYCSILVKTREGRPIKIEGNPASSVTGGGTNARVQASVLSLYDYNRIKGPGRISQNAVDPMAWKDMDAEIKSALATGNRIRILSHTQMSPTAQKAVAEFCTKYPNAKWVSYDPVSSSALLDAASQCFGERAVPDFRFDLAETIVSFNADFLGTWISPIEYASQYAKGRKINKLEDRISHHIQVESHMSLTGSNADNRILVKPSEQSAAVAYLYNEIAAASGQSAIQAPAVNDKAKEGLKKVAASLLGKKGKSLVVCGNNNVGEQMLVFAINNLLGNLGATVKFDAVSYQRQGSDADLQQLMADMKSSSVDSLIIWQANPAYDLPFAEEFAQSMANVKNKISLNTTLDETTLLCSHVAPDHHFLESWGDVQAKKNCYSLIQPTINPIFDTRQAPHSFLVWAESAQLNAAAEQPYYEYVKKSWQDKFAAMGAGGSFQTFWDETLHNGIYEKPSAAAVPAFKGDVAMAAGKLAKPADSTLEISFIETVAIGSGDYAGNPWLQEMPDPITRCVWGNYLMIPIGFDGDRRFTAFNDIKENGEQVELTIAGKKNTVAAVKQFGQMPGTVSIALGYGRKSAGDCGTGVGTDVYPSCTWTDGYIQYYNTQVEVSQSLGSMEKNFACVQHHHTLGVTAIEKSSGQKFNADEAALVDDAFKGITKGYQGSLTKRSILRHGHINELKEKVEMLQEERAHHQKLNSHTLYPSHDYKYNAGHHWGMHVDLNACIGCGSCTVACMAENNVPVVGKKEVSRHHEMSWLRIDRYYYGDVENPNVVYQPMMCQHCNNAPCENVCPVNATNHSQEGLNQMAYNRCVGTRYCANNCPYKVRRFNWYDYTTADLWPVNQFNISGEKTQPFYSDNLVRMVLNPDVTVRSRGVIEKCSFCVQRIQEGKLNAKKEQRSLTDNDVKTACQTACPTSAITFGDMNNEEGVLFKKLQNPLNYIVLEEINAISVVNYTMKVNNRDENLDA